MTINSTIQVSIDMRDFLYAVFAGPFLVAFIVINLMAALIIKMRGE